MRFEPLELPGVVLVDIERFDDARGFFARTFCAEEFAAHGLPSSFVQCNVSYNARRGTLRGMHYQVAPREEAKLVRCTRGAIVDVIVDLRPASSTHKGWTSVELTAENHRALFVPIGFAHGFLTIADETEVSYQMAERYAPDLARGVRWNDPAFGIAWPLDRAGVTRPILSERDAAYADYVAP